MKLDIRTAGLSAAAAFKRAKVHTFTVAETKEGITVKPDPTGGTAGTAKANIRDWLKGQAATGAKNVQMDAKDDGSIRLVSTLQEAEPAAKAPKTPRGS